jgi:hypothetical protein
MDYELLMPRCAENLTGLDAIPTYCPYLLLDYLKSRSISFCTWQSRIELENYVTTLDFTDTTGQSFYDSLISSASYVSGLFSKYVPPIWGVSTMDNLINRAKNGTMRFGDIDCKLPTAVEFAYLKQHGHKAYVYFEWDIHPFLAVSDHIDQESYWLSLGTSYHVETFRPPKINDFPFFEDLDQFMRFADIFQTMFLVSHDESIGELSRIGLISDLFDVMQIEFTYGCDMSEFRMTHMDAFKCDLGFFR